MKKQSYNFKINKSKLLNKVKFASQLYMIVNRLIKINKIYPLKTYITVGDNEDDFINYKKTVCIDFYSRE
jgi:hypothetical protein